jgi:hypothetical protein
MATAKQLAWRKKFGRLAKSGAFKKNPGTKKKSNQGAASKPLSVRRNGKRVYGAAAQAVLNSRAKKTNSAKRPASKKAPAKKRNAQRPVERGGQVRRTPNSRGRRRNSAATESLFAEFQGRPSTATVDVLIPDTAPADVYCLGQLTQIKTDQEEIDFDLGDAYLLADENGNLHIGATKKANSSFDCNEFIGEIKDISYQTTKAHLDNQEIEYIHKFGEEGGKKPALITNEVGQLEIVGGDYFITPEGIRD